MESCIRTNIKISWMKFEDPWQFAIEKEIDDKKIKYIDLMELSQGAPEIGSLSINGKQIDKFKFGGPLIYDKRDIYIPIYIRNFFCTGFKIAKINIDTLDIEQIGKIKDLIFLDKVENDKIIFYENRNKTIKRVMGQISTY